MIQTASDPETVQHHYVYAGLRYAGNGRYGHQWLNEVGERKFYTGKNIARSAVVGGLYAVCTSPDEQTVFLGGERDPRYLGKTNHPERVAKFGEWDLADRAAKVRQEADRAAKRAAKDRQMGDLTLSAVRDQMRGQLGHQRAGTIAAVIAYLQGTQCWGSRSGSWRRAPPRESCGRRRWRPGARTRRTCSARTAKPGRGTPASARAAMRCRSGSTTRAGRSWRARRRACEREGDEVMTEQTMFGHTPGRCAHLNATYRLEVSGTLALVSTVDDESNETTEAGRSLSWTGGISFECKDCGKSERYTGSNVPKFVMVRLDLAEIWAGAQRSDLYARRALNP